MVYWFFGFVLLALSSLFIWQSSRYRRQLVSIQQNGREYEGTVERASKNGNRPLVEVSFTHGGCPLTKRCVFDGDLPSVGDSINIVYDPEHPEYVVKVGTTGF